MKDLLKSFAIFAILFVFFLLLQGTTRFADPDCFYNTKMALLMKNNLVFKEFPWLQFSVLKDNFVDHHFLYHIFLIPFVSLEKVGINPLLGVRISAIFFASLMIFIFYLILKKFKIRYPLLFVFLLLISAPFVFRISLARAPAVSGIFLLLGTYFILKSRNRSTQEATQISADKFCWPLFVVSFFYVWLYSAWLLLSVVLFFYIVGSVIVDKNKDGANKLVLGRTWSWSAIIRIVRAIISAIRKNASKVISCLSGITLGLIINPYFPVNLKFYYHQIIQIAVVNFHHKFGVGSEWYPYDIINLFRNLFVFFIILLIATALFFAFNKRQNKKSWTLFLITFFFFIYTLKARRAVEYFVPFGVLFIAFVYDNIFQKKTWPELEQKFKKFFTKKQQTILVVLVSILVLIAPYFIVNDLMSVHRNLQNFKFNHLEKVSQWIKENVAPGKTIFNSNWDHFGFLFYYNSNNYYITGLDQTFMYSYDPNLLELYIDITKGLNAVDLKNNLKNKFNSEYILVSKKRNKEFYRNLEILKDFERVYEDEEMSVFKTKP